MHRAILAVFIFLVGLTANVGAQLGPPTDLSSKLKLIESIDLAKTRVYQARFTERNELFLSFLRGQSAWSFRKGSVQKSFSPCNGEKYRGGTLNREGNRLSISCEDFSVEVWNLETGNILKRFNVRKAGKSHDYLIPYVSPDGKKLVAEIGERAELWEIESSRKIADFTSERTNCYCNRSIYSVEFSPDSKVVAVAFGGMVFLWNAENGELLNRLIDKKPDFWGY
ncbi:MAG: hypothetical protein H0U23_02550 [Blastocatellia bacterium]|nr:hypothetical protein [Blastocatellia bacterium]